MQTALRNYFSFIRLTKIQLFDIALGCKAGRETSTFVHLWNAKWYNHCGKQYGGSSKVKHRTTLQFNNCSIYPKNEKILIQRVICTSMFIAALFTIAKLWKQSKCPWTDEWVKKMWGIHTHTHTHTHSWILLSH